MRHPIEFDEAAIFALVDPEFSLRGAPTPKVDVLTNFFAENCMKMKEFGPKGARVPGTP